MSYFLGKAKRVLGGGGGDTFMSTPPKLGLNCAVLQWSILRKPFSFSYIKDFPQLLNETSKTALVSSFKIKVCKELKMLEIKNFHQDFNVL